MPSAEWLRAARPLTPFQDPGPPWWDWVCFESNWRISEVWRGLHEAARFPHALRRRGSSVAARGARAAAGEATDHWVPGRDHAFRHGPMDCRFYAAAARARLD